MTAIASRDVLEIDALGPELASQLADGYVLDLADLFEFIKECREARGKDSGKYEGQLRKKGFSVSAINKMIESVEQAKIRDWDRWLLALNIEGIGKTLGKQLSMALELSTFDTLCGKLMLTGSLGLEGIGEKKLETIMAWCSSLENQKLCRRLHDLGVRPKGQGVKRVEVSGAQPLKGMAICVTGIHLGMEREDIHAYLKSLGSEIKTGISKKCTHVIAGIGAGPSKLAKARELGILVLHTDWLKKTLEENGIKVNAVNMVGPEEDVEI